MHTQAKSAAADSKRLTAHRRRDLTPQEISVLRVLCEQVAVPLDQLPRFLGCPRAEAEEIVDALQRIGCVVQQCFLAGDAAWIWPSRRGARLSGTSFGHRTPTVRWLTHRRAVNEVRLYLAEREPGGRWVCEREVERAIGEGQPRPDAIFEVGGERHAIEVELSRKPRPALHAIIASHSRRYDAIIYFCGPQTRRLLVQARERDRWPKLVVRDVPGLQRTLATRKRGFGVPLHDARAPKHVRWANRRKLPRRPKNWERDILALLCEQGAAPLDQLARFLGCDHDRAQELAAHLCDANFARRAQLLATEPEWIWLSDGGTRLSQTGFKSYLPAPGALARLRAINEVRLRVEAGASGARWIGWRSLRRELCGAGRIPKAVVEVGAERHAIEVELTRKEKSDAVAMIAHRSANYDAVICFCTAKTRRFYERLAAQSHWPKLLIHELPTPGVTLRAKSPSRWRHCLEGFEADARAHRVGLHAHPSSPGSRKLFWQPAQNPTRSEVDDPLWAKLEQLIPADCRSGSGSGARRMPDRTALSGILYIARNDIGWNELPHYLGYGSGVTCMERLRRWESAEAWKGMERLLRAELRDADRIAWPRLAPQSPP